MINSPFSSHAAYAESGAPHTRARSFLIEALASIRNVNLALKVHDVEQDSRFGRDVAVQAK
jgi:hypothetical protein